MSMEDRDIRIRELELKLLKVECERDILNGKIHMMQEIRRIDIEKRMYQMEIDSIMADPRFWGPLFKLNPR